MTMSVDEAMELARTPPLAEGRIAEALEVLRLEVLYRWEQRTALSFRLQDLRATAVEAGVDDMSPLYLKLHEVTSTAESWMHPSTLSEAAQSHLSMLKRRLATALADAQALRTRLPSRFQIGDPVRTGQVRGTVCGVRFQLVNADEQQLAALDAFMDVSAPTPAFEFPKIFYDIRTRSGAIVAGVGSNDVEPGLTAVPATEAGAAR